MRKATFCISIDTEFVWGRVHQTNIDSYLKRAQHERRIIKKLLKLHKKYNIHATWAIVGHLMLSKCDKLTKHAEIIRPKYSWLNHDWFHHDPGGLATDHPEWFAPEAVEWIKNYPNQEIGSHTFSHLLFGEPGLTRKSAESDMVEWNRAAKAVGINNAKSFVFPQNKIGHVDLLLKYGFKAYRDREHQWFDHYPSFVTKTLQALDLFLPISPPTSMTETKSELTVIPSSMYFPSARGLRKHIPAGIRAGKAIRGINKAIQNESIFHLWLHPTDLVDQENKLLNELEMIFKFVQNKSNEGRLASLNMGELVYQHENKRTVG